MEKLFFINKCIYPNTFPTNSRDVSLPKIKPNIQKKSSMP